MKRSLSRSIWLAPAACLAAALAALLALAAPPPAQAHDLWLERTAEGLTVLYGHRHSGHDGAELTEGAELIAYGPEMIVRVDCFGPDGKSRLPGGAAGAGGSRGAADPAAGGAVGETPVRLPGDCAAAFVLASTGYWSKTPQGTKNLSRKEARSPIRSWLSYESVKRIDVWSDAFARPLTADLEITPLENPLALRPGAKLTLLVTLDGKPVAGATVAYDEDPRGATGPDGRVNVKLRHGGFQAVQASVTRPLASAEADEVIRATSLNFEIGEAR